MTDTSSPTLHFVVPGPIDQPTGGYRYDQRMVAGLRAMGWDVTVHELPGRFPFPDADALAAAAALLPALPDGARVVIDGLALPAFRDVLPDRAGLRADRFRIAALVHHPLAADSDFDAARRTLFDMEKRLLEQVDRIVTSSGTTVGMLAPYGVAADRVRVAPPGTDPAPAAQGSGRDAPALLCVATLTPRKGHLLLLEALAECRDAGLDWTLLCLGATDRDPATTAAVRAAVRRLGFEDRVALEGAVGPDRLAAAYDTADAFVLASALEGYGMAFAEAMARGLPIVASGEGAVAETVPAAAALIVPVGDRAALVRALTRIIADRDLRRRLAQGSRAAGLALPDWTAAAARFAAALREP